eukprot:6190369-Pleurochrysis_carterae.AAC.4
MLFRHFHDDLGVAFRVVAFFACEASLVPFKRCRVRPLKVADRAVLVGFREISARSERSVLHRRTAALPPFGRLASCARRKREGCVAPKSSTRLGTVASRAPQAFDDSSYAIP